MSGLRLFEEQNVAAMNLFDSTDPRQLHTPTLRLAADRTGFESDENPTKYSEDGHTTFTPAPIGWPNDMGFNLPPSVNPLDPPPPTNFEPAMAELFSLPSFAGDIHSSDTAYMPDNSGILDQALYLNLPHLMPFDQPAATSFRSFLPNQSPASPMTCFTTSGLLDTSNKNSINFAASGRNMSSTRKDKRSIGTIVRAECRRLCGAIMYTTVVMRQNSRPVRRTKYTLPDPDAMPRRDSNGMLLHNPRWNKPTTNIVNELFIDAVVDAVQLVQAESTVGCERGAIRKVAKTYFRQLSITYADQTA